MNKNQKPTIEPTADIDAIVAVFRSIGWNNTADRLVQLDECLDNNDPYEKPINLKSLRNFASFIIQYREQLSKPELGVGPDGDMCTEWRTVKKDIMVMVFLPSGLVRFVVMLRRPDNGHLDLKSKEDVLPEKMMKNIKPFLDTFMKNKQRDIL